MSLWFWCAFHWWLTWPSLFASITYFLWRHVFFYSLTFKYQYIFYLWDIWLYTFQRFYFCVHGHFACMYMSMHTCMVGVYRCQKRALDGSLGAGVTRVCEPLCGSWGQSPCLLQEQPVFWTVAAVDILDTSSNGSYFMDVIFFLFTHQF